ncbi:MAG: hypothetical protein Q4A55_00510 [Aerococcus sp.]|nr:hypothetical protein [Aerococcus sp.]
MNIYTTKTVKAWKLNGIKTESEQCAILAEMLRRVTSHGGDDIERGADVYAYLDNVSACARILENHLYELWDDIEELDKDENADGYAIDYDDEDEKEEA